MFDGSWPHYVVIRHALVKGESGILNKWRTLLNDSTLVKLNEAEPSSAKLSGNIFVIFSVFLIGIGISSATFLVVDVAETFIEKCTAKCFPTNVLTMEIGN